MDRVLALAFGGGAVALAGAFCQGMGRLVSLPLEWRGPFAILSFLLGLFLVCVGFLQLTRRLFPLQEGWHSLQEGRMRLWKLQGFVHDVVQNFYMQLLPKSFRPPVYRLLGARLGRDVMVCGTIVEPSLVRIGEGTILGEETIVSGHLVEGGRVFFGRVVIGRNVTVGAKSGIMPDVWIGDDAVLTAASIVMMGTRIPPGEVWGGNPARRRRAAHPQG